VKVLLITNLFAPDELAGASLYSDLGLYLKNQGHDVRVLCTFSYYPAWSLRDEDAGVPVRDEVWNGIPLRRIAMYVPKKQTGLKRMLSDLSFFFSIIGRNFADGWYPDAVLTASPMFSQCLAQRFLYPGRSIPRMIVVQDFVVDAALELEMLNLPGIQFPLKWLERWSFRSARTLSTISTQMLEKLRLIVGNDRHLLHIPNWIHASLHEEIKRQAPGTSSRRERTLLYSGNLGVKQGLPDFIETFTKAAGEWSLQIHGGGAEKERLVEATRGRQAIHVAGVLDEVDYVRELLTCSACLVTQMPGVGANFLPSKLLPSLAAGTPVLAVCEGGTPLALEVSNGQFGEVVAPGDVQGLRSVLDRWSSDPRRLRELGDNALKWSLRYEREVILPQYEAALKELVVTRAEG
jgi:colanic acid biosynthesis glycosyl transferase WcaI